MDLKEKVFGFPGRAKSFLREKHEKNPYFAKKATGKLAHYAWAIFRTLLLIGLSFIIIYPVIYMFSMGFRVPEEVMDPSVVWIPRTLTLNNFKMTIDLMKYWDALKQTVLFSILSSLLAVASCAITGYGFARFKFKGKKFLFVLVLLMVIIPSQTTIIPQFIQFRYFDFFGIGKIVQLITGKLWSTNILDTGWSLYLPAIFANGIRAGIMIYIFRQFFRGLPKELEDAAYIDGCGPVRTFIQIMIPLSSAAFITVFLFSFVWYWNDYYVSGMFFSNIGTVSVRLSGLRSLLSMSQASVSFDPYSIITYMQAGCLLTIAPPLIVYIIFQRFFTQSIEKTGIVG
ncbi:MAG: carbohydrate ABC transporter permease [Firmicutes bacterium]|jgi:multiple sugar transport system permease protein|nr:carbohydrate ABC transporter permease [Bacillota bacterium]